ncbi:hypothetical protein IAR50_001691 [Cryptococcus sp. DSM 104548]
MAIVIPVQWISLPVVSEKYGVGTVVPDDDAVIANEDVGVNGTILSALPGNNPVWGRSGPKAPDSSYVETGKLVSLADGSKVSTSAAVFSAGFSSFATSTLSGSIAAESGSSSASLSAISNSAWFSPSSSSENSTSTASLFSSSESSYATSTQTAAQAIATDLAAVIESSHALASSVSSDSASSTATDVAAHKPCVRRKRSSMNWWIYSCTCFQ